MRLSDSFVRDPLITMTEQLQRLPAGRPWWLTLSLPWPEVSLLALLKNTPDSPRTYWESSADPVSLVGWGKAVELTDWGEHRFQGIQDQAKHLATQIFPLNPDAPLEAGPRWIGGFSFFPRPPRLENPEGIDVWDAFPDAYFILNRFQVARFAGQTWLTINHWIEADHDLAGLEDFFTTCLAEAQAVLAAAQAENMETSQPEVTIQTTLSQANWQTMVNGALEHIYKSDFRKVVIARTLQADFNGSPSLEGILKNLSGRYPDCFRFLIEPERASGVSARHAFTGASPELLAAVEVDPQTYSSLFRTAALAGTARRGPNPAEDDRLAQELLDSPKERQEHAIVVEAIQSKLAALATELKVPAQPLIRKLGNVQHLETPMHGRLRYGRGVLDIVAALHPTPAMGGWPQAPAQDYLASAEPFTRGWYASPVGWFDPHGNGLFAVGIRSGVFNDQTATFFAGAGIVADSDPDKEWQETGLKFKPLLDAIGGAENG